GNAERLILQHGMDLRYCHAWRKWLVWNGRRWIVDATAETDRRAVATVKSIWREVAEAPGDERRKGLIRHALESEGDSRIRALLSRAASVAGVPVTPDELDADPWLLNVLNGTINLRTGALRPHRREDLITKMVPIAYDAEATCPKFL